MDENDLQELCKRVARCEESLERCEKLLDWIKFFLICASVVLVCLFILPLQTFLSGVFVVAAILSVLFGFMYCIYWIFDRLFGNGYLDRLG